MNDEDENKEVISLFVQLGYVDSKSTRFGLVYTIGKKIGCDRLTHWDYYTTQGCQELTLPQLRDLVVLHRNDVSDANWVTEGDDQIYKDSNGKSFIFREQGWDELQRHEMRQAMWEKIKPKPQPTEHEQGLISGSDALRALADGEEVQIESNKQWVSVDNCQVYQFLSRGCSYKFRLKPRTITLNGIEIPCCGTNYKQGQLIWILNSLEPTEYCSIILDESDELPSYWWSTEEEIKQVVAALRGGIKG